jgi:hypothetical protein
MKRVILWLAEYLLDEIDLRLQCKAQTKAWLGAQRLEWCD